MEGNLNQAADGTARGLKLWYTMSHVAWCPQCRRFLESLKALIAKLNKARESEPSEESVQRILGAYKAHAATQPPE